MTSLLGWDATQPNHCWPNFLHEVPIYICLKNGITNLKWPLPLLLYSPPQTFRSSVNFKFIDHISSSLLHWIADVYVIMLVGQQQFSKLKLQWSGYKSLVIWNACSWHYSQHPHNHWWHWQCWWRCCWQRDTLMRWTMLTGYTKLTRYATLTPTTS